MTSKTEKPFVPILSQHSNFTLLLMLVMAGLECQRFRKHAPSRFIKNNCTQNFFYTLLQNFALNIENTKSTLPNFKTIMVYSGHIQVCSACRRSEDQKVAAVETDTTMKTVETFSSSLTYVYLHDEIFIQITYCSVTGLFKESAIIHTDSLNCLLHCTFGPYTRNWLAHKCA